MINLKLLAALLFFGHGAFAQSDNIPSRKNLEKMNADKIVRYSYFGAKGNGKADDVKAIAAAHEFANQNGFQVKADDGATYYISGKDHPVIIKTNTDFGDASFIIDDRDVEKRDAHVFVISSVKQPFNLQGLKSLKRNQDRINAELPGPCLITVTDAKVKRYIRYGNNANNGSVQTDIFIVDGNGNVDMDAPIMWDFDEITEITALPIDETTLTVSGGKFTTIANQVTDHGNYYSRGIAVSRSNVIISGMQHFVTGEGPKGAPYNGFISIRDCYGVTVRNMVFTGHKVYQFPNAAGVMVSKGTYDIAPSRAINLSFINCTQTNDINDRNFWGIMGSNFCKNIVYDGCVLSRFDAHQGVVNATIRNSTLGHQGINTIGAGKFTIENCTVYGNNLVNLRSDYGSTWEGELIIRNCVFVPGNGRATAVNIIGGANSGQHNFGYICYLPERITLENIQIDDSKLPTSYKGPAIFANFNSGLVNDSYKEQFPYERKGTVIMKNVTTTSGKEVRLSDNLFMFKDTQWVK